MEPELEITLRVEESLSSFPPDTNQQDKVFTKMARFSITSNCSLIRKNVERDSMILTGDDENAKKR
jgi:hypothetical protein